jgi:hypothetical protein
MPCSAAEAGWIAVVGSVTGGAGAVGNWPANASGNGSRQRGQTTRSPVDSPGTERTTPLRGALQNGQFKSAPTMMLFWVRQGMRPVG